MPSHKISPYRLKMRQDHVQGQEVRDQDLWDLTNLSDMNEGLKGFNTILDLLEDYFEYLNDDGFKDDDAKRTLSVTKWKPENVTLGSKPESRTLEAEISYGRYNRVADHNDADAFDDEKASPGDNREEAERDRDTVAETRLHFLAHVPVDSSRTCFLTVHSYGRGSYKRRLEKSLEKFVLDYYDPENAHFADGVERREKGFKMEIDTVAGPEVVEKLKKETIVGFEVRKRDTNVPQYMKDGSELSGNSKGNMEVKYTSDSLWADLKMKKDEFFERIQNEKYPLAELVENEPSKANALVEAPNDSTRKVNLTREEIRMEKTIPRGALETDSEGRVTTSSVGKEARRYLNEKLQSLGKDPLEVDSKLL